MLQRQLLGVIFHKKDLQAIIANSGDTRIREEALEALSYRHDNLLNHNAQELRDSSEFSEKCDIADGYHFFVCPYGSKQDGPISNNAKVWLHNSAFQKGYRIEDCAFYFKEVEFPGWETGFSLTDSFGGVFADPIVSESVRDAGFRFVVALKARGFRVLKLNHSLDLVSDTEECKIYIDTPSGELILYVEEHLPSEKK